MEKAVLQKHLESLIRKIRRWPAKGRPTFFEATTVLALLIFREAKVDFVVWETGLGGRLDATNVIVPECCVLTSLGRDHESVLGVGWKNIGMEKAGILKGECLYFPLLGRKRRKDLGISSQEIEVSMEGGEAAGSGKGSTTHGGSSPKAEYGSCDCRWKVFGFSRFDFSEGIGTNCLARKIHAAEGAKSSGVRWST